MAVYTNISATEIKKILLLYNIQDYMHHEDIIPGVENTNYLVHTKSNKYVLTIFEGRNDPTNLPEFVCLINHMQQSSIPCPQVLTQYSDNLNPIRHTFTIHNKHGILSSFLSKNKPYQKKTLALLQNIGQLIGNMHNIPPLPEFKLENNWDINWTQELFSKIRSYYPNHEYSQYYGLIEQYLILIQKNYPLHLERGIIHGDLFDDNIFFEGDEVTGVIDFYFSTRNILLYDIAVTIVAWCFEVQGNLEDHDPQEIKYIFKSNWAQSILNGYNEMRNTNFNIEDDDLKILLLLASVRFLCSRLYDKINANPDDKVIVKCPEEYWSKARIFYNFFLNI